MKTDERSYKLGQILAVYHIIEETYPKHIDNRIETTAKKVFGRYMVKPLSCMDMLEKGKIKAKQMYAKSDYFNGELYEYFCDIIADVMKDIDNNDNSKLSFDFVFGFNNMKQTLSMDFQELKTIQSEKGYTKQQMAKKIGIPICTWEYWDRGYTRPPKYIEKIINIL